jgi:hypothetical protein
MSYVYEDIFIKSRDETTNYSYLSRNYFLKLLLTLSFYASLIRTYSS